MCWWVEGRYAWMVGGMAGVCMYSMACVAMVHMEREGALVIACLAWSIVVLILYQMIIIINTVQ